MKLVLSTLAIFATLAFAKNCRKDYDYCALTLLKNGMFDKHTLLPKLSESY